VEVLNVIAFVVGVALVLYTIRAAIRLFLVSRTPEPESMIRAGYLCLRHIAAFFWIPVPHDPAPTDPISIERSEFDGGGFIVQRNIVQNNNTSRAAIHAGILVIDSRM
jgi:hypothetical protein